MKIYNLLFPLFISLAACGEKPAESKAMSLEGYELSDITGTDMQQAIFKDAKGKTLEEGILRNSKKHGTWVVYLKDRDTPQSISSYVDGVLNGAYFEFAPYGQLSLSSSYKNNKLDGHYIKYKSVRKAEEGDYVDGKLEGIFKKYYDGQEKVQQEIAFKQDKQDGEHLFYNENGEVTMRYIYKDGVKVNGGIVEK